MTRLHISLIGFPGCGRTTLFRALAGNPDADSGKPLTVTVPDERLGTLSRLISPERTTGVSICFEDVQSPAFSPERMAGVRGATALALVLDNFCLGGLSSGMVEAETELAMADLHVVEKRLARLRKEGSKGSREFELLERIAGSLSEGSPCRSQNLSPDDLDMLSSYSLLSLKPLLVVINTSSENPPDDEATLLPLLECAGAVSVPVDAHFELELAEIDDPDERTQFLRAMGFEESGLERIVSAAFRVMDLIVFYTVKGGKELRAWPLRRDSSALDAAATIHTDMASGFIRAHVVDCDDFESCPDQKELKRTGLLRTEGRDYVVRDGDILEILFSAR
jgi:ribosome-binding ATPase YchF (GTP1/OBG family)